MTDVQKVGEARFSPEELARRLGLPPPTAEQRAVIGAPLTPQVVVAGAGSGKTETMAARVVWLVANDLLAPEAILGLTFTRKAAGELAERVQRRLRGLRAAGLIADDLLTDSPTIATYNSYAASLVRDHGLLVGVEPTTRLLGEASSWQLVHDLVERWDSLRESVFDESVEVGRRLLGDDLGSINRAVNTLVEAVLSLAGQTAEHLVDLDRLDAELADVERRLITLPHTSSGGVGGEPGEKTPLGQVLAMVRARRVLVPVLKNYQEFKRRREVMDFGDQVVVAARLAQLPEVAAGQRRQYEVVLLDEFQDTSYAQLELLARLFGGGHPVTAVGDPNQSIYGWRGASADNLDAFRARFKAGRRTVPVLGLTTSWRNPQLTLAIANRVARPLRDAGGVQVRELSAAPTAGQGSLTLGWHQTVLEEADWLAEQIADRWQPGAGTAAVICRQRAQFAAIEAALQARGLPVEVIGLGGLLHRPEVADLVATLQVLADPTRSDALARLLTGPRWQLGPRDLVALGAWARELSRPGSEPSTASSVEPGVDRTARTPDPEALDHPSLVDAVHQLPPPDWCSREGFALSEAARNRLTRLAGDLTHLRRLGSLPLVDLVHEVEQTLLLNVEVAVRSGREQLDQFAAVAADFADGSDRPTLTAFVSWLAAAADRERGLEQAEESVDEQPRDGVAEAVEASTGVVQLLTVHAAKGLEWDVVAVPGLMEQRFPSVRQRQSRDTATGWPAALGELPYPLRGDAAALPQWHLAGALHLAELKKSLEEFKDDCGTHEAREERRLAYVAVTRARRDLLLSGFSWDLDRTKARAPSRFLREALQLAENDPRIDATAAAQVDSDPGTVNPLNLEPVRVLWPVATPGAAQLRAAGEQVRAADPPTAPEASEQLGDLVAEIDHLLAERDRDRTPVREITLPGHLSASRAVQLAGDPGRFALDLRRPMPVEPRAGTRRGTVFHEWIERRLHSQSLLDLADLVGAGDDDLLHHDPELEQLKVAFEASQWARRELLDTEVDIETVVAGVVFRGRIDAVFAAPAAAAPVRYDVVDWKTGPRPRAADAEAAQVQLAVYRTAYARLKQVPVEQVRASFFYVASGETITPTKGLDERRLAALVADLPTR